MSKMLMVLCLMMSVNVFAEFTSNTIYHSDGSNEYCTSSCNDDHTMCNTTCG